jgi:predicted phosphoribosyltransferase/pimeloyl-ACP methyl ester carboxylesterase
MVLFRDRRDAGRRLAAAVKARGYERPLVLGIPRGGVPVAAEVARETGGDLGVVVARKLRSPWQPELAIGAVAADGTSYINMDLVRDTGADEEYLAEESRRQAEEARKREEAFDGHRRGPVAGRDVVVVDDGIATGATAIAAIRSMKAAGARKVVLAVPVGPRDTIHAMRSEADDVICVSVEDDFYAIGQFYEDFSPFEDEQVRTVLDSFAAAAAGADPVTATVSRDGVRLAVRLAMPAGAGPWPCVVFVHGLGSGKDSPRNVVIAEHLLDAGVATVVFDLSGHGDSSGPGDGLDAYVEDLAAVCRWAASQPGLDPRRFGIAGSSLGSVVAVEAVKRARVHPATLVLRAPPVDPGELDGLDVPALVVVGSADPLLAGVEQAVATCPAATLRVVQGAGHLFEEEGALEEALTETVAWFVRILTGVPAAVGI